MKSLPAQQNVWITKSHLEGTEANATSAADEMMSTSTVSKVEEDARMVDIEATFEDRYSKLKLVAIKLKKKTVEQEKKINELHLNSLKKHEEGKADANAANEVSVTAIHNQAATNQKEKLSDLSTLKEDCLLYPSAAADE